MLRLRLAPSVCVILLVAGSAACSRARSTQPQVAPRGPQPVAADRAQGEPAGPVDSDRDVRDARAAAASDPSAAPGLAAVETRIYFDFDRSDLTGEARSALAAKLAVLLANPEMRIQIVGHADERGSDEYNNALGQARAAAAKRYLTQRGVAADRI
jgi:peptidoglycan-associated lipoprotein